MSLDVLLTDETYGIIPDWFECDWEVQEILHMTLCYKDHEFDIAKVLRSSDVLTGGRSSFKATVCKKYMTDQWGSIGLDLLDSATSGLDSVASDRECEFCGAWKLQQCISFPKLTEHRYKSCLPIAYQFS